ncbi:33559_t:CDS:1, partial [Racocetra persica]
CRVASEAGENLVSAGETGQNKYNSPYETRFKLAKLKISFTCNSNK